MVNKFFYKEWSSKIEIQILEKVCLYLFTYLFIFNLKTAFILGRNNIDKKWQQCHSYVIHVDVYQYVYVYTPDIVEILEKVCFIFKGFSSTHFWVDFDFISWYSFTCVLKWIGKCV